MKMKRNYQEINDFRYREYLIKVEEYPISRKRLGRF